MQRAYARRAPGACGTTLDEFTCGLRGVGAALTGAGLESVRCEGVAPVPEEAAMGPAAFASPALALPEVLGAAAAVAAAVPRALAMLGLAGLLAAANPVTLDARDDTKGVPLAALAASVAAWAAEAGGLPVPAVLPEVRKISRAAMTVLHYGPEMAASGAVVPVEALYDRANARILLAEDWTGASPRAVSVLVHEMVHHLEASAGVVPDCPAAGEARAYAVQQAWLEGFGSDLRQTFGIDEVTLQLITHCFGYRRAG